MIESRRARTLLSLGIALIAVVAVIALVSQATANAGGCFSPGSCGANDPMVYCSDGKVT